MKILFMGTPEFAVFSLEALCRAGEQIVGVVTQPDKPRGRGYETIPSPVKVCAREHGIPVYQPKTLRDEAFADLLAQIHPDLIIVIAFGKILPENVLSYPPLGCINVHGSLLPRYRGAAPMQRAIMEGETQTGVTTMYMDAGVDTGDMLLRTVIPIEEDDNFEVIHDKLGVCGAETLLKTLAALRAGTLRRERQDDRLATYAAKIEKTDCLLDFSLPARVLHNHIRGLSPIPLAFTHTPDGKMLKIIAAHPARDAKVPAGVQPGTVLDLSDGTIVVACGEGAIALTRVLPEGKARMDSADFIRGRKIKPGDVLR